MLFVNANLHTQLLSLTN